MATRRGGRVSVHTLLMLSLLLLAHIVAGQQAPTAAAGGGADGSVSSAMPVAIGSGFGATVLVISVLVLWRRRKQRRVRMIKAREMEQYEKSVELERATRALQRAREVLAQRTGNADWNPKLQANVQSMQLDEMADGDDDDDDGAADGAGEWRTDGPFKMGPGATNPNGMGPPGGEDTAVAVCEKAMQLVAEFGAQGAMVQVMYAAKKQLEQELRDLEHSEGIINVDGGLEEESEDPEWRERVKDQMQLKELERQLAAVDEETEDMLSEEERQRRRELEALSKEGTVEIETFPTIGHKILVRKHAPPPPRPVAWAKMATSLHRPDASETLVQRSGQESKAVQQYSQALRAMSEEIERHDGWGAVDAKSIADVSNMPQRPVVESPSADSAPRHEIDLLPPPETIKVQHGNARLTASGVVIGGHDDQPM